MGGGGGVPLTLAKYEWGGGGALTLAKYKFYTSVVHVQLNCMLLFNHNTIQFWTVGPRVGNPAYSPSHQPCVHVMYVNSMHVMYVYSMHVMYVYSMHVMYGFLFQLQSSGFNADKHKTRCCSIVIGCAGIKHWLASLKSILW